MSGGWKTEAGVDANAIHDNVAGEIAAITEKVTPVSADLLVIEDSADSNNKKKAQLGNLSVGGGFTYSGAGVNRTSTHQTINAATTTAIIWNGEDWDTDSYHDNATNPTRITVPTTDKYLVTGSVHLSEKNANDAGAHINVNGSATIARWLFRNDDVAPQWVIPVSQQLDLTANDYIEIFVFQAANSFRIEADRTSLQIMRLA